MEHPHDIPLVSSGEMAFALDLFVSAANQRFTPEASDRDQSDFKAATERCEGLYDTFQQSISAFTTANTSQKPGETTLRTAFRRICVFFADHTHQFALCARVLAFYLLSERTSGSFLEGLSQPDASDPRYLTLDPRVIGAIASIPLSSSLSLSAERFLSWVQSQSHKSV